MAQTQIHNVRGAGVRRGRACPGAAPAGAGEELSREGRLWAGRAGRPGGDILQLSSSELSPQSLS